MAKKNILFLTLKIFSATGGIEKVCRVGGKAINEYAEGHNEKLSIFSMHDRESVCEPYFPSSIFKGFSAKKKWFIINSFQKGIKSRVVVLSHINLLLAGYLIKLFSPETKLILIAHGIEAWKPVSSFKQKMLQKADLILPVSRFTKGKMITLFHLPEEKFTVLNNCLDPFLPLPANETLRNEWREKYKFSGNDIVLMTLSRLSAKEKNKNYDKVLAAIKELKPEFPGLKYLFVGKYEAKEKERLDILNDSLGIKDSVIFTGFIADAELAFYYNMADVYVMPSEKEGFGISFIEAMYYNKPVIAGNKDGSVDALLNGRLGLLVNPESQEEVSIAIAEMVSNKNQRLPDTQLLMDHFGYPVYKNRWKNILEELEV